MTTTEITDPLDIVLVTGQRMPRAEHETPQLLDAVRALGLTARILPWGDGYDWARASLVVVRTPWDYFGRLPEFLAWAHEVASLTQLVNPVELLEWNSHKGYLLELAAAGVPVVPTTLVAHGAEERVQASALADHHGEVVVKPAVSVGAHLTERGAASALAVHLAAVVAAGDALVQPLVPSVLERGEVSLLFFGGRFSHAVRKVPAAGDFRVHLHHGGREVEHSPSAVELSVASAALAAAPVAPTYARVDLVGDDEPLVMELELIEPELFLRYDEASPARFARVLQLLLPA